MKTTAFRALAAAVCLPAITCALTTTLTSAELPAGCVGWWRAEDSAADMVSGANATLVGGATYAAGEVGRAFSFDGDRDAVLVVRQASLELQDLTVECWMKRSSTERCTLDSANGNGTFFAYSWDGYGFGIFDNGQPMFTKVGRSSVASTRSILDTNWHHVAVTKSGNEVVFYIDGVAEVGLTYAVTFAYDYASDFLIGAGPTPTPESVAACFLGCIDELSVYNRGLLPAEVAAIHAAGAAGKCPPSPQVPLPSGCVGWWRGEDNAVDTVGGNNGTLRGDVTYDVGKVGQAFRLDGIHDGIYIGDSRSPDIRVVENVRFSPQTVWRTP